MKLTQYIFLVPTKNTGKYALYSSFNNVYAILDEELKNVLESKNFSALPQQHLDSLKKYEIMREDDEDELKMLQYNKKTLQFAPERTEFYLIPTLKCNMGCRTCTPQNLSMSESTVAHTLEAVKKETREKKTSQLWTVILGGEPLMEQEITLKMSKELTEWAKKENIVLNNSLATNGTLLTEEVLTQFIPYISSVQVTLEGPRHWHDRTRLVNGKGSFDEVIKAVQLLMKYNIHTIINVPLTRESCALVPELVDFLKSIGISEGGIIHIRFFLSADVSNGICYSYSPLCNENVDDALLLMKVWEDAWSRGFRATAKPTQTPYCSCVKDSVYIADPLGNVYPCISMVGDPAERTAVIKEGALVRTRLFYDLMGRDATTIEKCRQCKYTPLCAGGCPLSAKKQYNTYYTAHCGPRKALFDKRIELFLRFKHPKHFGEDEGTRTPNV